MKEITITMNRLEELLYKEAAYEMKRNELKKAGYVTEVDRVLFGVPEPETVELQMDGKAPVKHLSLVVEDDF